MDIDLLEKLKDKESKGFSEIVAKSKRKFDDIYLSSSDLNSTNVRQRLKEAYISGYLDGLDSYQTLMSK